ncbi:DUF1190 family protein [Aestuariibacter salexigens]|uniref:DUF1190 family protein n=1 Tax=Aestuariibacter salexigens TaxID=226010 RepID=UPI00042A71BE
MSKRTSSINLSRMRKAFALKPISAGVAAVVLSGCGDRQEAFIYSSVDECVNDNPEYATQCQSAYQQALEEARRTGPKYNSEYDCEYEFGANQCRVQDVGGGSFWMPMMAGFMIGNLVSNRSYYYQPMYTSYSRYSPLRYRWMMADGRDYGDLRTRKVRVREDAFKPKPAVNRTIKRGGFGSSVRAKSSWGSSRSSGWGG